MQTICIFDAEYWADNGSLKHGWKRLCDHKPYLIQLAASKVMLDKDLTLVDTINIHIQPVDAFGNPVPLTPYFEKLTNISKQILSQKAIPIPQAFSEMGHFFSDDLCFSYGDDPKYIANSAYVWDQPMPFKATQTRDVRHFLHKGGMAEDDIYKQSSGSLANFHGLPFTGHVHDARDDVESILITLRHYLKLGKLTLSDIS